MCQCIYVGLHLSFEFDLEALCHRWKNLQIIIVNIQITEMSTVSHSFPQLKTFQ